MQSRLAAATLVPQSSRTFPRENHDIHATILHLLGLDHTRLTYRHNGRAERLTDVAGNVIAKALA